MLPDTFAEQFGVASRRQLKAAGLSDGQIDANINARRWQQLNEAVVVLHNGPLTCDQQLMAATLSASSPVALAAITAATRGGLVGFESSNVELLVMRGARVLPIPGVRVVIHESRRFNEHSVLDRLPPTVSIERAVVDAASWSASTRQSARLLSAAVQQRLTSAGRLREELDRAGRIRHARFMRSVVVDIDGGAQALSELEFVRFCRRHRLPRPKMQVRVDSAGRRRYLDALIQGPTGMLIGVEIDGGVHLSLGQRWSDTARDNDLLLAGVRTLRFASSAIYADDPRAVAQLRQALQLVSASSTYRSISR